LNVQSPEFVDWLTGAADAAPTPNDAAKPAAIAAVLAAAASRRGFLFCILSNLSMGTTNEKRRLVQSTGFPWDRGTAECGGAKRSSGHEPNGLLLPPPVDAPVTVTANADEVDAT
jgi:hypothetical protein